MSTMRGAARTSFSAGETVTRGRHSTITGGNNAEKEQGDDMGGRGRSGGSRGTARESTAALEMEIFPLPEGIIAERDVPITMRDGVRLSVNVFRPERPGKFPVIMAFVGPYGKDVSPDEYSLLRYEYHRRGGPDRRHDPHIGGDAVRGAGPRLLGARGITRWSTSTQGVSSSLRGRSRSTPRSQTQDYYEAIEWAGTQEWSNGNVGLNGVSYLAVAQWYAASTRPPHLKAIMPWEGGSDHIQGPPFSREASPNRFSPLEWKKRNMAGQLTDAEIDAMLDPVANQKEIEGSAPSRRDSRAGPHLRELVGPRSAHPGRVRGVQEDLVGAEVALYARPQKVGGILQRRGARCIQERFFDYFLKGIDNGMLDTPRIRLEVRENRDATRSVTRTSGRSRGPTTGSSTSMRGGQLAFRRGRATRARSATTRRGACAVRPDLRPGYRADRPHEAEALGLGRGC